MRLMTKRLLERAIPLAIRARGLSALAGGLPFSGAVLAFCCSLLLPGAVFAAEKAPEAERAQQAERAEAAGGDKAASESKAARRGKRQAEKNGAGLRDAARSRSIPAYHHEMRRILQLPAGEALALLKDPDQGADSLLESFLFSRREAVFWEGVKFVAVFVSPLGKTNSQGRSALQEARRANSLIIYKTLHKMNNRQYYELSEISENFWPSLIPLSPLENSGLAKALMASDLSGFQKEAESLLGTRPLAELLSVFHSKTSEGGDTLFHLAAKAKFKEGEEEKFAQVLQTLNESVIPNIALEAIRQNANCFERQLSRCFHLYKRRLADTIYTPLSYGLIFAGASVVESSWSSPAINIGISLAGAGLCMLAFRGINKRRKGKAGAANKLLP